MAPLDEKIARLDYVSALKELRIRGMDNLWSRLQTEARRRPDLDDAQVVHDVSWVLTQLDAGDRRYIVELRDAAARALAVAYGPHALDMLADSGLTVETFVLPVAKTLRARDDRLPEGLRPVMGGRLRRPGPEFTAVFVRCWAYREIVSRLPRQTVRPSQRGSRVLLGGDESCHVCGGGGFFGDRITSALDDIREKVRQRVLTGGGDPGEEGPAADRSLAKKLLAVFGDTVACDVCGGRGFDAERVRQALADRGSGVTDTEQATGETSEIDALLTKLDGPDGLTAEMVETTLGEGALCPACGGTGADPGRCRTAAEVPLPTSPDRRVADFVEAAGGDGGIVNSACILLLGGEVLCPDCVGWMEVPEGARNDWICPVLDNRGENRGWCRVAVVDEG